MNNMNKDNTQIISLEFQFGNLELNQMDDIVDGVLSVRTKFLDYPSIEINEDELCNSCPAEARFEKAKQMLIPINDNDLKRLKNNFTINIKIMKTSLVEELIPVMKQVGYTNVNIARTFTTLLLSNVKTKPTKECPAVKVLSDQLEVIDACTGSIIGTINVYIRIKSFGNCIVTGMQQLMENKTNVFKQCFNDVDVDDEDDDEESSDDTADSDINDIFGKPSKHRGKSDKLRFGEGVVSKDELGGADMKGKNATSSQRKKTATGQPADDQTVKMLPILDYDPEEHQGPLSGLPVNDTVNVYALYVGKKNDKKKLFSRIQMEVRIPKVVTRSKERYTRDVQCEPK